MLSKCNNRVRNMAFVLRRLCFFLTGIALMSCGEKAISPEIQPQPAVKPEVTNTIDVRRESYTAGIAALSVGNYSSAQRTFTEFIRKYPQIAGAYTNLAIIHFENREFDQALMRVNQAIALNDRQSQAYNLRAQLLIINGKILQARDDYLKAIELNPGYANAQYNLALLYDVYLQDVKLALRHYEIYMSLIRQPDETTQNWIDYLKRTLNNG